MQNKISQAAFTLIELVVVITILGILAAFAIPRFASLEGQARLASTQALAGSVRSGAALAHALWLAQGDPASTNVSMEGQSIVISNGYPDDATIASTLTDYSGFLMTTSSGTAVFTKRSPGGSPITNCFVTYAPAPSVNTSPTITTTTGGC